MGKIQTFYLRPLRGRAFSWHHASTGLDPRLLKCAPCRVKLYVISKIINKYIINNMAQWRTYKCKKCGYSVQTEPNGHYALMSGEYYNFKCSKCKNIVHISADELAMSRYNVRCPICGDTEHLSTWNPIEGKCPRCNRKMELDSSRGIMMAD